MPETEAANAALIKKLTKKRYVCASRITETYTVAQKAKTSDSQKALLKVRFENLEESYSDFQKYHNEIIGIIDDKEYDQQDAVRKDADSYYFGSKQVYFELFPPSSTPGSYVLAPNQSNQASYTAKLPKLTIPNFDGNLQNWTTFYDMYRSMVHDSTLPNISKFQYLISLLKGEPLNLIKSIPTTDANYAIAFKTLEDRYQNKRHLATNYWNAINNTSTQKTNSSKDLRNLLDTFNENVAALEVLGFPTNQWCFVLFNMLLTRLDSATRTAFEIEHSKIELPTYLQLTNYLESHCRALESVQMSSPCPINLNRSQKPQNSYHQSNLKSGSYSGMPRHSGAQSLVANTESNAHDSQIRQNNPQSIPNIANMAAQYSSHDPARYKCRLCQQPFHSLSQCPQFLGKTPSGRLAYVKQANACINCLRSTHRLKNCPSTFSCRICHVKHHTLLHFPKNTGQTSHHGQTPSSSGTPASIVSPSQMESLHSAQLQQSLSCECAAMATSIPQTTVLLSTTKIEVLDSRGNYQIIRAVLDSASQANFITQKCLNRLGLSRTECHIPVVGISQSTSDTCGLTSCTIKPIGKTDPVFSLEALVLSKLCSDMPSVKINTQSWGHISNLTLGDEHFSIPAPVDMLLGADIYSQILKSGRIPGSQGQASAFETCFGWVLLGQTYIQPRPISYNLIDSYLISLHSTLEQRVTYLLMIRNANQFTKRL